MPVVKTVGLLVIALLVILIGLLYVLFTRAIIPRFFLSMHRIAYDLDDEKLHIAIVSCLHKYIICKANYDQSDFGICVVTFWCPSWQSKRVVKELKQLNEVEVI